MRALDSKYAANIVCYTTGAIPSDDDRPNRRPNTCYVLNTCHHGKRRKRFGPCGSNSLFLLNFLLTSSVPNAPRRVAGWELGTTAGCSRSSACPRVGVRVRFLCPSFTHAMGSRGGINIWICTFLNPECKSFENSRVLSINT